MTPCCGAAGRSRRSEQAQRWDARQRILRKNNDREKTRLPGGQELNYGFVSIAGRRHRAGRPTGQVVGLLAILVKQGLIRGRFGRLAALFIVAGALGNLIDRIFRGYVVDLFDLRIIHFAIFNVADVFITLGGLMLVIYFAFLEGRLPGGKTDGEQTTDRRA